MESGGKLQNGEIPRYRSTRSPDTPGKAPATMALAPSLIPGFQYRINSGWEEDTVVTIVDNTPFKDGDAEGRQRKITVKYEDGHTDYILPRMLSDKPVGVSDPAIPSLNLQQAASVAIASVSPITPGLTTTVTREMSPITDPMDARLDHLRPSKSKVRRYIKRTMPNGMTDVEFLLTFTSDDYRATNDLRPANVMLKGDTQSGKTFLVEVLAVAWAEKMGLPKPMPIFTLSGSSGVTDYDLFGQTTSYTDPTTGHEGLVWLPGVCDMAAQCGGILYLDEVNGMGERVTLSLHPLADHRHQFVNRNKPVFKNGQFMPEVVTGHTDLWIIGTYNEGYRGMGDMNEAFLNRFRHIRWGYDDAVENKLIKSPAVRLLGEALRTARRSNQRGLRTPVGTAALQRLEEDVAAFGIDMGIEVFIGMFKAAEADVVAEIVDGRSIRILLEQEAMQANSDDDD